MFRLKGLCQLVLTKALKSKRQEVFLSILGTCYTTLDATLFEDAAMLLLGYIGTYSDTMTVGLQGLWNRLAINHYSCYLVILYLSSRVYAYKVLIATRNSPNVNLFLFLASYWSLMTEHA